MSLCEARRELNSFAKLSRCIFTVATFSQQQSQLMVGRGMVRVQFQDPPESRLALGGRGNLAQDQAELIMRFGEFTQKEKVIDFRVFRAMSCVSQSLLKFEPQDELNISRTIGRGRSAKDGAVHRAINGSQIHPVEEIEKFGSELQFCSFVAQEPRGSEGSAE